ncbi:50S ribosome-binding GTPase [Candidatus Saccharibacteria bacterium]|nr:50S ribosome-binding GTPase [Candidatus Saccharibacteria bacterium]
MNLKIGIVGLPNVGKSTLFNALTNAGALAANYPFATIEPNVGIVPVPDERLDTLAKIYDTDKVVPATVEFVDIAGLVQGASKGEGLGNKFLAHIRECQAICHVVRAFKSSDIVRADNKPEDDIIAQAKDDIDIINLELQLADEETKAKIAAKRKKDPTDELIPYLTDKPVIYMFNVDENGLTDQDLQNKLRKLVSARNEQFEVVRDNGSEIASEPRNDGRERSGPRTAHPGTRKLYPLEIYVDGKFYRYATCYVTIGMTAEACELFDEPKFRKQMQKGHKSSWRSYLALVKWYFKNRHKRQFIPEFKLNGKLQHQKTSDYAAVSGRSMCRVMKGGDDYLDPHKFRSMTDRLTNFWRLFKLMVAAILVRTPGTETTGDILEFTKPATVELQAEGEYQVFKDVKTIEIKKVTKCLKVIHN